MCTGAQVGRERVRSPLPFFENRKKFRWSSKIGSDCVHLGEKTPKIAVPFFLMFLMKCLSKCHNCTKPPSWPEKFLVANLILFLGFVSLAVRKSWHDQIPLIYCNFGTSIFFPVGVLELWKIFLPQTGFCYCIGLVLSKSYSRWHWCTLI